MSGLCSHHQLTQEPDCHMCMAWPVRSVEIHVDIEPDDEGYHQVRISPYGIATFGRDIDDAFEMAFDALASYRDSTP